MRAPAPAATWLPLLALLVAADARGAAPWSELAPLQLERQEVAVAEVAGKIYVVGGFLSNASVTATVEVYDPDTGEWSFAPDLPTPVHHAAAVGLSGKLYVIGGWPDFFLTPLPTIYAFDPATNAWNDQLSPMPTARGSPAAAVVDGRIYVAGGSPNARERDFAVYDPAADDWDALPDMPTPRNHLAAAGIGGRFFAVGGRTGFGIDLVTDALDVFDPTSGTWQDPPPPPMPTPRGGIAAIALERFLVVYGGEGNEDDPDGVFDEVEAYDSELGAWLPALTPLPVGKHGIGAALLRGRVHVPGGGPVEGFGTADRHDVHDPTDELAFTCADGADFDADGQPDLCDVCVLVANGPAVPDAGGRVQYDADADGKGNACDGDFNQDDFVGGPDFDIFLRCFDRESGPGAGPAEDPRCEESDMNGDGFVGGPDFDRFLAGFDGAPGPGSGAASACGLGWELVLLALGLSRVGGSRRVPQPAALRAATHRKRRIAG